LSIVQLSDSSDVKHVLGFGPLWTVELALHFYQFGSLVADKAEF